MITATCLCQQVIHDLFRQSHGLSWGRDEPSRGQMDTREPALIADEETGHVFTLCHSVLKLPTGGSRHGWKRHILRDTPHECLGLVTHPCVLTSDHPFAARPSGQACVKTHSHVITRNDAAPKTRPTRQFGTHRARLGAGLRCHRCVPTWLRRELFDWRIPLLFEVASIGGRGGHLSSRK